MRTLFDTLLAFAALVLLSPLLLIIALVVMIDSAGGPLYLAPRVGKNGVGFRMWKFRTMIRDASRVGPCVTGNRDPRITRAGRFLRRTKLDELPQFVNVLMGQMALVGPRPETPSMVALYTSEQKRVLAVKPGLTGKVQVETGDEPQLIPASVDADDYYVRHLLDRKLKMDLEYIQTRSFFTDMRIIAQTAIYVLRSAAR